MEHLEIIETRIFAEKAVLRKSTLGHGSIPYWWANRTSAGTNLNHWWAIGKILRFWRKIFSIEPPRTVYDLQTIGVITYLNTQHKRTIIFWVMVEHFVVATASGRISAVPRSPVGFVGIAWCVAPLHFTSIQIFLLYKSQYIKLKNLNFNPSVPDSLICVGLHCRQIGAFRHLRRDCTPLRDR